MFFLFLDFNANAVHNFSFELIRDKRRVNGN
jgi:hypothetical protein